MTTRVPWGAYHASAQIDWNRPYFLWNCVPWLGFGLLKLGPVKMVFNWPVMFEADKEAAADEQMPEGIEPVA